MSGTDLDSPLERVLAKFPRAVRSGDGWAARCPAHDDSRESLSIGYGRNGRVLLKCHRGCKIESITGAVGLGIGDLFEQ